MRVVLATVASLLVAQSNATTKVFAGESSCKCTAQCVAQGDPHLIDFDNAAWKSTEDKLTFYKLDNFVVWASVYGKQWIETLYFGDDVYDISQCTNGARFQNSKDFGEKGFLSIEILCKTKNGKYLLEMAMNKTDEGDDADFHSLEAKTGSVGLCPDGPDNLLKSGLVSLDVIGNETSTNTTAAGTNETQAASSLGATKMATSCSCSSSCQLIGDPHLYGFYGGEDTIKHSGNFTLYEEGDLKIIVYVSGARVRTIYFDNKEPLSAKECKDKSTTFSLSYTWTNGDSLSLQAFCENVRNSKGFFFNVALNKTDVSAQGGTFREIEAQHGASGLCELY